MADEFAIMTQNFQGQVKGRLGNLLEIHKTISHTNNVAAAENAHTLTLSIGNVPENVSSSHMDIIEDKLQGNRLSGGLTTNNHHHVLLGKDKELGILDLQISNVALFLVLLALLGGTIYYWVWQTKNTYQIKVPNVKDRNETTNQYTKSERLFEWLFE